MGELQRLPRVGDSLRESSLQNWRLKGEPMPALGHRASLSK
jgi:hypothetical protein